MASSLTRQLVEHARRTGLAAAPDTLAAVRALLIDHLAVAAWGAQSEIAVTMRAHVLGDLARSGPSLPIIGTDTPTSAVEAAMANAVAAACYEYDDTHTGASAHPGSVIFPAAMAAAALAGADERHFVAAVVAGYEVMCRVAMAANPHAHRARHFHPTATAGHFGSAAAAAVCLGLDVDQTTAAVSLAGTVAGGSMQFLVEGAITKQLHPAYAVQRGVQAAQLAARGFPGLADPIGGSRGFLAAQSQDPRPERLLAGSGVQPAEITRTGIKPYPSCRNTQSAVGALLELLAAHPLKADEAAEIRFGLIGPALATVAEPIDRKRRPQTLTDAQFSMPFVAAVLLLDGELGPAQFAPERYAAPDVRRLMDRVTCVHDPALDERYPAAWPAWVEITTVDGARLRGSAEHPKGDPANPLSASELQSKLEALTRHCYSDARRGELIRAARRLPEPGTLATILRCA